MRCLSIIYIVFTIHSRDRNANIFWLEIVICCKFFILSRSIVSVYFLYITFFGKALQFIYMRTHFSLIFKSIESVVSHRSMPIWVIFSPKCGYMLSYKTICRVLCIMSNILIFSFLNLI